MLGPMILAAALAATPRPCQIPPPPPPEPHFLRVGPRGVIRVDPDGRRRAGFIEGIIYDDGRAEIKIKVIGGGQGA